MTQVFINNGSAELSTNISTTALTINTTKRSTSFPGSIPVGDFIMATLVSAKDPFYFEIIKITAVSESSITILRAQENTTARVFQVGDKIELRLTAQALKDFQDTDSALDSKIDTKFNEAITHVTTELKTAKTSLEQADADSVTAFNEALASLSTSTQEKLNTKAPLSHVGTGGDSHANATIEVAGFMSAADKTKLNAIAAGAQVNTVTSVAGKTGAVTLTKADVGLSNVDNTSDINKPISTATQTALNSKAPSSHIGSGGSAHSNASTSVDGFMSATDKVKLDSIAAGAQVNAVTTVAGRAGAVTLTKGDVGLGSVDNTSDANKPVSNAQLRKIQESYLANPSITSDPNLITTPCELVKHANCPDPNYYWYITTTFYTAISTARNQSQTAIQYSPQPGNEHRMYTRHCYNNVWTSWKNVLTSNNYLSTAINLNALGGPEHQGIYYQVSNASATEALNYPALEAGTLFVTQSAYGCQQMYVGFVSGRIWVRGLSGTWNGSGGPWFPWIEQARKLDLTWNNLLGKPTTFPPSTHTHTANQITFGGYDIFTSTATSRNTGLVGTYDSAKIDQIWAMGSAYRVSTDGANYGTLYGIAYAHTNNPATPTMAGGHQILFASNGTVGAAIGLAGNIWTSGYFLGNGSALTNLHASNLTTGTVPAARIPTLNQSTTGNAATATTLQTARAINGTNFNGSAAITTALWGTGRTITVGGTGKTVNGSSNISWSLAEIGAAAATHTHPWSQISGVPATATRWPTAAEAGASPSNHTHTAAAVGAAPASHTHTAAQITDFASAIGAMAYGSVGTYGFFKTPNSSTIQPNVNYAGSSLRLSTGEVAPAGTWRSMSNGLPNYTTLFVRIS